jgi:hypothetical protein
MKKVPGGAKNVKRKRKIKNSYKAINLNIFCFYFFHLFLCPLKLISPVSFVPSLSILLTKKYNTRIKPEPFLCIKCPHAGKQWEKEQTSKIIEKKNQKLKSHPYLLAVTLIKTRQHLAAVTL